MAAQLATLRALALACQATATGFSDEQAAEGLAVTDELRAFFLARLASSAANLGNPAAATLLQDLPPELLSAILSSLDIYSLARLAATCRPLWLDAPTPASGPRDIGPVEAELRRRAETRGLQVGFSLPEGSTSWVACLLGRDRRNAQRRQAPLAAETELSLFVDTAGRLLTCGISNLGHAVDPDADPNDPLQIVPPTPVPSMQGRRIVSVATSEEHCLALSAEGEVYSWGYGTDGSLGHADGGARAVPSRIDSLSRIESIAAGPSCTSAAVDEVGRLFTWGAATTHYATMPSSLGYALDSHTAFQLTPKWVDTLSQDRVVGVALGVDFTLAVTDAGAVFSFGYSEEGALGHGSPEAEVLPRRIEALAQTGRRFVAVAAGTSHALALTEGGELYGWGIWSGHGQAGAHHEAHTPKLVTTLIGVRIKLVYASACSSCAVTETGEIYTWGGNHRCRHLGHGGWDEQQLVPRRVERLSSVRVAAVALGVAHMLVADEDGGAWACGSCLGLDESGVFQSDDVREPTLIPTLRVRTRY